MPGPRAPRLMADSNNTPDTPKADAVPADAPVPNAAAEPAAQVAAAAAEPVKTAGKPVADKPAADKPAADKPAASAPAAKTPPPAPTARPLPPPMPADYAMPDDYATASPVDKVKAWAEKNPGLAIVAAAGVGLLVGRIVSALAPEPEPPSLQKRIETRAKALKKSGAVKADVAGDAIQEKLDAAAEALREAGHTVAEKSEEGYERTRDFAEHIADAVKVAVTGVAAKKLDDWMDKIKS